MIHREYIPIYIGENVRCHVYDGRINGHVKVVQCAVKGCLVVYFAGFFLRGRGGGGGGSTPNFRKGGMYPPVEDFHKVELEGLFQCS